jgi:prolyl oligopeptidase
MIPITVLSQKSILMEKPYSETHFGKTVQDPYRYIENSKDTLVQKWFKDNNLTTNKILSQISGRQLILNQLLAIDKRDSFSITNLTYSENLCFYLKKTEADKVAKLYSKSLVNQEETLLFDPSNYKKTIGNNYIINYINPSWDNKTIALGLSKNGEEIGEIAFLDRTNKILLPEIINNAWPAELGGVNWMLDNSGIVYINIPVIDPNDKNYILNTESVIYKLGDKPEKHKLILSQQNNPELNINSSDFPIINKFDGKDNYVFVDLAGATNYTNYYYAKTEEFYNDKINWKPLFEKEDGLLNAIILGDNVYSLSSKDATNFKIIKTNMQNLDFKNAEVVVPESTTEVINDFVFTKDGLFYATTKNGVEAKLYFVSNDKSIKPIKLPIKAGTLVLETKNKYSSDLWVTISGWLNAKERFTYDVLRNEFKKDNSTPAVVYPEFKDFVVEEIEIPSHDGVMVPVSLIYKKELKKDKKNNVLLDGYGSYGFSKTPRFQPRFLSWVMNGGILVVSHVRGGGEKGEDWHKGGYKSTKSKTWKDFIATAEYLIKEKITTNKKIVIHGRSAGGILVGRAMTERPDLFKVMLCENGDLNSSRIKDVPNGPNSMKEFGNPDIEEEFKGLEEIDAYQHIQKGIAYPACLISVGMNDARVAPWMSGKFVAKLQASTTSKNPVLFKVDYDTGHGLDNSNLQLYKEFADLFAFAFWQLGHPDFKLIKK